MQLQFSKMHGLGNDFMVIDAVTQPINLSTDQVQTWGDRHFGIGFDQLLIVEPPSSPDIDFRYRIFNADGSEVQQCGNGARCFARFVYDKKLTAKKQIRVETSSGLITLNVGDEGLVTVNMGSPELEPAKIPFLASERAITYDLNTIDQGHQTLSAVSMGNPHGVLLVDNIDTCDIDTLGPELEQHPSFPEKANIGFMECVSPTRIRLRVFERGVGETNACGTGACAAVVAGRLRGLLEDAPIQVELPGGSLTIHWQQSPNNEVIMTGDATHVYEGKINL